MLTGPQPLHHHWMLLDTGLFSELMAPEPYRKGRARPCGRARVDWRASSLEGVRRVWADVHHGASSEHWASVCGRTCADRAQKLGKLQHLLARPNLAPAQIVLQICT